MSCLAIIPARGGSKGVPGKNYAVIDGKPLIEYSIEAALKSNAITEVWVSSDDERILDISKQFSGVQLHHRPNDMAEDHSPIGQTIYDIIQKLSLEKKEFDYIILLQPTSPLRTSVQIDEAIGQLSNNNSFNSLVSVIQMDDVHPARMYWPEGLGMTPVLPQFETTRRQEIPKALYRNGAIYVCQTQAFLENQNVMQAPTMPYVMPFSWWLNIDDPRDLIIANALIPAWKKGKLN